MNAIIAMLIDSYRELNSKRLFWVTLFISIVVVIGYGSIGFNSQGMTMFFGLFDVESEIVNSETPVAAMLYRGIFSSFIVSLWLAWIATILALISTTTIFPDFMAGGSIDLVLSKPIGRLKLFIIKYFTSLLFVLLQVTIFCAGVFICMAWRIDEWNWIIFAAIPLVTVFFSYLYAVNVLFGVLTRSALTALLLTVLFWFSLFSVAQAEGMLNFFTMQSKIQATVAEESAERSRDSLEQARARIEEATSEDDTSEAAIERLQSMLDGQEERATTARESADRLEKWHRPIRSAQSLMPKTAETIALLDRWLKKEGDPNLLDLMSGNMSADSEGNITIGEGDIETQAQAQMIEEVESRSLWYVIGTSLVFEFVVLMLAAWVFCRRDY